MDEETVKMIAAQLRKPEGEMAVQIGERMNEGNFHINQYAIEALDVKPSDRVLEIGMGNGLFVKKILSAGKEVHYSGCDFSEEMVEDAVKRNKASVNSGQSDFHACNAEALPFDDNIFDKIITVNTLYFWENQERVFREIKRVMKKDAIFVIAIRPKFLMENYAVARYGFNMFSKEELVTLLTMNGFSANEVAERTEPIIDFLDTKMKSTSLIVTATRTGAPVSLAHY